MTDEKPTPEQKPKKSSKGAGAALIVIGCFLAFSASQVAANSGSQEEAMGAWAVPIICWVIGFYLFFKSGGKVV